MKEHLENESCFGNSRQNRSGLTESILDGLGRSEEVAAENKADKTQRKTRESFEGGLEIGKSEKNTAVQHKQEIYTCI